MSKRNVSLLFIHHGMKEAVFIEKNKDRWREIEHALHHRSDIFPDKLSGFFIQLTDDLSYARTYYPGTPLEEYLNGLTLMAHRGIYKNRRVERGKIRRFWSREFPILFYKHRKDFLIALMIFFISSMIGVLSQNKDNRFARFVMQDRYINMTLENIKKGDPLAVYRSMTGVESFLGITLNNIKVSFMAFVYGIFFSVGSAFVLLQNGVMLGTFHTFLSQQDVSFWMQLTIWVHGTLEIFAIIAAGAAGIVLGKGFLFPGTYSRIYSIQAGTRTGIRLIVGLIPLFIVAGFLEGFITRQTLMPDVIKLSIIIISLFFILFYFFIYPRRIHLNTIAKPNNHGKSNHSITQTA